MDLTVQPEQAADEDALTSLYEFLLDDERLAAVAEVGLRPVTVPDGTLGIEMLHDAVTIIMDTRNMLAETKSDVEALTMVGLLVGWIKSRSRGERVVLRNKRGDRVSIRTKDPETLVAVAALLAAGDQPGPDDDATATPIATATETATETATATAAATPNAEPAEPASGTGDEGAA